MHRRGTGRTVIAILVATVCWNVVVPRLCTGDEAYAPFAPAAFGAEFPELDGWATGEWWKKRPTKQPFSLDVPRQDVIAFAIYTVTAPPGDGRYGHPERRHAQAIGPTVSAQTARAS
jgi:hypothetical protein